MTFYIFIPQYPAVERGTYCTKMLILHILFRTLRPNAILVFYRSILLCTRECTTGETTINFNTNILFCIPVAEDAIIYIL